MKEKKIEYKYSIVEWDASGRSKLIEQIVSDTPLWPENLIPICKRHLWPGKAISCEDDKNNPFWSCPSVATIFEDDREKLAGIIKLGAPY